jgi:phosphatidylglycerol:prolipoprotein diacylglycerol transferase
MTYVHNLSPFAIQLWEGFGIRWYGLAYLSGFVSGYLSIVFITKRGGTLFTEEQLPDFVTYMAFGVLGGGRLGYALFYAPDLLGSFDAHFPYWGLLKVNEGGMASHGGIMGVLLACWVYSRKFKIPYFHCVDLTTLGASVGFFFGRIANFINGELYGRVAPEGFRWAVKFPQEMLNWGASDFAKITPAVEALGQIKGVTGETITLNASLWQQWVSNYGDYISREHVHEVSEALIQAVQHKNVQVTEALAPFLAARYPSQLYQSVLEGLLVFLFLFILWRKPQKMGVISGWFGVLYATMRIIGEQWRLPDAQIGYQLFGLTRGQWLSIGFLAAAIIYLTIAYRRNSPKIGGWMNYAEKSKA